MSDVIEFLDKSIQQQFRKFKKKAIIAIDYHEREYYGDKNDVWVIGGKHKNGTNWFHKYATVEIISDKKRITPICNANSCIFEYGRCCYDTDRERY